MTKKWIVCALLLTLPGWANPVYWDMFKQDSLKEMAQIPGWCTKDRAERLMDLIYETKPQLCVEVGAFAGLTTFAIARTLKFLGGGTVYAIDTWDTTAYLEGLDGEDPSSRAWSGLNLNMDQVFQQFNQLLYANQLTTYCLPMRRHSLKAAAAFQDQAIDLLYLDGNISRSVGLQEVTLYFPKVKTGGFICLCTADVPTRNKAIGFLMKHCKWVKEKSIGTQWLIFQKP